MGTISRAMIRPAAQGNVLVTITSKNNMICFESRSILLQIAQIFVVSLAKPNKLKKNLTKCFTNKKV